MFQLGHYVLSFISNNTNNSAKLGLSTEGILDMMPGLSWSWDFLPG